MRGRSPKGGGTFFDIVDDVFLVVVGVNLELKVEIESVCVQDGERRVVELDEKVELVVKNDFDVVLDVIVLLRLAVVRFQVLVLVSADWCICSSGFAGKEDYRCF